MPQPRREMMETGSEVSVPVNPAVSPAETPDALAQHAGTRATGAADAAPVFMGIDTSCYTTSVALMRADGRLVSQARRILAVKAGHCGLQQHEMVFQHTRNLPELVAQVRETCTGALAGIAVSASPRPAADSYMPAFLVGRGLARSLSAVTGAPLVEISHQENHLEAGVWSAGGPQASRFLLLHASGGTTDLLLAERAEARGRYTLTPLGGSLDLHAGQFIDRVGVALGLGFPCGPALEALATQCEPGAEVQLPVSARELSVSLSGPCSAALRALQAGAEPAALAYGTEACLAETFARLLRRGAQQCDVRDVLLVGGVGCNAHIRAQVEQQLAKRHIRLWVPDARYSGDNASGCAAFAWRHFTSKQ